MMGPLPTASNRSGGAAVAGAAAAAIFLVAIAVLFAAIYFVLPGEAHFYAFVGMGVLSLLFALGAYLAQAFTARPLVPGALGWGFLALGFGLLLVSIVLNPGNTITSIGAQLTALFVLLVAMAITAVLVGWRMWSKANERTRLAGRAQWESKPAVSAFDYGTAGAEGSPAPGARPPSTPP